MSGGGGGERNAASLACENLIIIVLTIFFFLPPLLPFSTLCRFALVSKIRLPNMSFSKDLFKNLFKNLVSSKETAAQSVASPKLGKPQTIKRVPIGKHENQNLLPSAH